MFLEKLITKIVNIKTYFLAKTGKNFLEGIFRSYTKLKEQSYETFYKLNTLVSRNFILPLMTSTERVVDMVLSVRTFINYF